MFPWGYFLSFFAAFAIFPLLALPLLYEAMEYIQTLSATIKIIGFCLFLFGDFMGMYYFLF